MVVATTEGSSGLEALKLLHSIVARGPMITMPWSVNRIFGGKLFPTVI